MPILAKISGLYASFLRRQRIKNWESDLTVFLKRHEDPYNFEGIELALLHLRKVSPKKLTLQERKRMLVVTHLPTIEHLLQKITYARAHLTAGEGIPDTFFRGYERQVAHRFDDFYSTQAGHTVDFVGVNDSLKDWIETLISHLRELETDNPERFHYYMRKLRKLWADVFHVLQANLETSFQ